MHPFRYASTTEGLLRLIEAADCPALGANNMHFRPGEGRNQLGQQHEGPQRHRSRRFVSLEFEDIPGVSRVPGDIAWCRRAPVGLLPLHGRQPLIRDQPAARSR
jgi:hypothetical protein